MSGKVPQNPSRVIGLELYESRPNRADAPTGLVAVDWDDDGEIWIQFDHAKFQPWDMRLSKLEMIIDLVRGKEYLREK
jgi:hypothetical protein